MTVPIENQRTDITSSHIPQLNTLKGTTPTNLPLTEVNLEFSTLLKGIPNHEF